MEDTDQRKLFIGGISRETTDELLKEHFGKYGSIVDCVIAKDRNTGGPRGFGFVSFSNSSAVDQALQDTHQIDARTVDVKKAIRRSEQNKIQQQQQQQSRGMNRNSRTNGRSRDQFRTKKIFVGGLSADLTEDEFKAYFHKFGAITDVVVMHDNVTHRSRGFGFITFDSEDAVEEVLQNSFHELTGKLVEVKRAVPKEGNGNGSDRYNSRIGSGRVSPYNYYQCGNYPPYDARYVISPAYGSFSVYGGITAIPYGSSVICSAYPGAYSTIAYGLTSVTPWSPCNVSAMFGVGGSPLPFGSEPGVYHLNDGLGGWANNVYNPTGMGVNGNVSQADTSPSRIEVAAADDISGSN